MKVLIKKEELKKVIEGNALITKRLSQKESAFACHFLIGINAAGDKLACSATTSEGGRKVVSMFYAQMPTDYTEGTLYGDFCVPVDDFSNAASKMLAFDSDLTVEEKAGALVLSISGKAEVPVPLLPKELIVDSVPDMPQLQKEMLMTFTLNGSAFASLTKGASFLSTDFPGMSDQVEMYLDTKHSQVILLSTNGTSFATARVTVAMNPGLLSRADAFWRKQNGLPEEGDVPKDAKIYCKHPAFPIGIDNFAAITKLINAKKENCGVFLTDKYITFMDAAHIYTCSFNGTLRYVLQTIEGSVLKKPVKTRLVIDKEGLKQALSLMSIAKPSLKNSKPAAKLAVTGSNLNVSFRDIRCSVPLVDADESAPGNSFYVTQELLNIILNNTLSNGNVLLRISEDVQNKKTGGTSKGPLYLANGDLENVSDDTYALVMPLMDEYGASLEAEPEGESEAPIEE